MMTGIIFTFIEVFEQAFRNLRLNIPAAVLEGLAVTVHKAMSVEGRHYHTSEHVLSLVNPENPVQSLAALFHDIVYYQVDRGFSSEALEVIGPYLVLDAAADPELVSPSQVHGEDRCYRMAMDIFNLSPGQKLFSDPGYNEFLSALVMAKKLRDLVPEIVLLQGIVYIEATIPFRGKDEHGFTPFDRLEQRLRKASYDYNIPLNEQEIVETIRGAVIFANKDVENFSEKDPALFLINTWKLLPEMNLSLRAGGVYSIRDYRLAMQQTDRFFSQLIPEWVFHSYQGVPSEEEYWEKVRDVRLNVSIARQYLGIKLLAIGILEALAECTGGNAPLALFMGEQGEQSRSLGDFLPRPALHPQVDPDSAIYNLLESGHGSLADFTDLRHSPLSIFVYCSLGPEGVIAGLEQASAMFAGSLQAEQFLQRLDRGLLSAIATACASMAPVRSDKLQGYINDTTKPLR